MSDLLLSYGIASYVSQDILIVPFHADFYVEVIEALRQDILVQLHHNPDIKGLIIDLSKINVIDLHNMRALEQTLNMVAILGVTGFLVGIQPSVTLALVELGYNPEHLNTALSIERATFTIHHATKKPEIADEALDMSYDDELDETDLNHVC